MKKSRLTDFRITFNSLPANETSSILPSLLLAIVPVLFLSLRPPRFFPPETFRDKFFGASPVTRGEIFYNSNNPRALLQRAKLAAIRST